MGGAKGRHAGAAALPNFLRMLVAALKIRTIYINALITDPLIVGRNVGMKQ